MTGHYDAKEQALQYDSEVVQYDNYIAFEDTSSTTSFIFYPGAKVYPYAYSYLTDANANVYIADFPFEIAFLDMDVADDIIAANPQIENWYIGGHSLGGVAASEYANGHPEIKGVVYLASYPAKDMSSSTTKSLAFFGTNDGLVTDAPQKAEMLPVGSEVVYIEGGNHSRMGDYGHQDKDLEATDVLAARNTIVLGAVSMVKDAIEQLESEWIMEFDNASKAQMVNNLLVSIISEKGTQPIMNNGNGSIS